MSVNSSNRGCRFVMFPHWRQTGPAAQAAVTGDCLFIGTGARADELAARLISAGFRLVQVRPGTGFAATGPGEFRVDLADPAAYRKLFAALGGPPARIVHAGTLDAEPEAVGGVFDLIALGEALAAQPGLATTHLDIVTVATLTVIGGDRHRPAFAALGALPSMLPIALPALRVRQIDVPAPEIDNLLVDELTGEWPGPVIALRAGRRWLPEPTVLPPVTDPPRPDGRYVITDGFGPLGLAVAEHLVRHSRARLALVSDLALPARTTWDAELLRRPAHDPIARAIAAVRRIEAAGGIVHPLVADPADRAALTNARAEVLRSFGGLDAVVHCLPAFAEGSFLGADRTEATNAITRAVAGATTVLQVFGDLPLDAILLCTAHPRPASEMASLPAAVVPLILQTLTDLVPNLRAGRVVRVSCVGRWASSGPVAKSSIVDDMSLLGHARLVEPSKVRHDLDEIRARIATHVRAGEGELLDRVGCPDRHDAEDWAAELAPLGEAVELLLGRVGARFWPTGYDRVVIHGPVPVRCWAHVRFRARQDAELTADITLLDNDGVELLSVTGLVMANIDVAAANGRTLGPPTVAGDPAQELAFVGAAVAGLLTTDLGPQVTVSGTFDTIRRM